MNYRSGTRYDIVFSVVIFIISIAIRSAAFLSIMGLDYRFMMGDDDDYHRLALSIINTQTLVDGNTYAYRLPVFPLFLSLVYLLRPDPMFASGVLIVLSSATCVSVYWVGKKWFNPIVGSIAAILTAFNYELIFHSIFLMTETLAIALVIVFMVVWKAFSTKATWITAIFSGLILAIMLLLRINLIAFFVGSVIVFFIQQRDDLKKHLSKLTLMVGIVIMAWSIWILRNAVLLGAFVPFTTQGGNAYFGVYNDVSAKCENLIECGHWINLELPEHSTMLNEVGLDEWQRGIVKEWIIDHPIQAIKLSMLQVYHLWRPTAFIDVVVYILTILYIIFFLNARRQPAIQMYLISAFLFSIGSVATIAVERFRLPLLPILYLLAASVVVDTFKGHFRPKMKRVKGWPKFCLSGKTSELESISIIE